MAKALIMPKFGFTQESAEIVRWLRHEGEPVEAGDPIAEVTTDKVNMEVEATAAGILAGLRYQEGDTVPVTAVIAYILEPGESLPAEGQAAIPAEAEQPAQAASPVSPAAPGEPARGITPLARQVARAQGVDWSQVAGSGPGGRVMRRDLDAYLAAQVEPAGKLRATPNARRLAAAAGLDLAAVAGSGPRGRVQGWDVEQAAAQLEPQAAAPVEAPAAGGEQVVPLNAVRRLIAERMQRSSQEAPHVYFDAEIDTSALEALRQRINARSETDQPPASLTALLVKAAAWALGRHPFLNSRWMADGIHLLADIHVGVAVAAEGGLIVPVLRHADRKGVAQLSAEMNELVSRARESKLRPDDVSGGTFTLTNLGMFGVDRFTAIINPPQTAILAVGRVRKVFVPDEHDQPVLRPVMTVTLGADHRVVDGAVAARFLADVREALEHPEMMVL